MASQYSNLSGEKDIKTMPVYPNSVTYFHSSNPPKIQYHYTPRKHQLLPNDLTSILPSNYAARNWNRRMGGNKNVVLQIASIIFGLIGLIVQVVSIIFWRGMISGNVIPSPSLLQEIFFFIVCFMKIGLLIVTINNGYKPTAQKAINYYMITLITSVTIEIVQGIIVFVVFVLMMLDFIFTGATWTAILAILAVDLITLIAATASCISLMNQYKKYAQKRMRWTRNVNHHLSAPPVRRPLMQGTYVEMGQRI